MSDPSPIKRLPNWRNLKADQAEQIVKERAKNTENVFITEHAFERIKYREITQDDVYWILRTGTVDGSPAFQDGEWKVIMVKRMPGKREAGVVTLFVKDNEELIIKTVEWMDLRR